MRTLPTPLGFTYRLNYVPKGSRNPREGLFRGADVAVVRHIEPGEAKIAFRIKWPEYDIWPLVHSRTPRDKSGGYVRNAITLNLLLFEGRIWWPNVDLSWVTTKERLKSERCLEAIKNDSTIFDMPEIDGSYDVAKVVPDVRELVESDMGERLAQAQAKTYENFLICGKNAYVRGGVPIYFRNSHHNKTVWEIDIASIGPDRHGDPSLRGLHDPPGYYHNRTCELALGRGSFWLADDQKSALGAAHSRQTAFPRIQVLMPELVQDVRNRVRLDSLFRETVRMFCHPFDSHWNSEPARSFRKRFDDLCDPDLKDDVLSWKRLELLRSFFGKYSFNHGEMDRIAKDFYDFDSLQRREPTWSAPLSADEDADVASLLT